jgi:hypothetical protein
LPATIKHGNPVGATTILSHPDCRRPPIQIVAPYRELIERCVRSPARLLVSGVVTFIAELVDTSLCGLEGIYPAEN